MKRSISLFLVATVLVFSLAVPSYAAESPWFNLLDYCSPNDSGSNLVDISSSGTEISFDYKGTIGYVDFTVMFYSVFEAGAKLLSGNNTRNLTAIKLDDYTWRFYGSMDLRSTDGFRIQFLNNGNTKVQFLNFRLTSTVLVTYETKATGYISYADGEEVTFYYNSYEDYGSATLHGSSDFYLADYAAYISFPDWKKYDFIDIQLYMLQMDIDSLSATLGGVSIPVEYSFFSSGSALENRLVNVTLDLTQCDRDSDFDLELIINGYVPTIDNRVAHFSIISCSAFLEYAGLSESMNFWYRLRTFLGTQFSNLGSNITHLGTVFSSYLSKLGTDISSYISTQTSALTQFFTGKFNSLDTWITTQTSTLTQFFTGKFNSLDTWITTQTSSITSAISTWGQKIYDVIVGDLSVNQDIQDATDIQNQVHGDINNQIEIAVDDWNDSLGTVSTGFNTAFQNATPSLIWLSDKAQAVFTNMGWFGNMFFFLGFLHVFFLIMRKSGLGEFIPRNNGDD